MPRHQIRCGPELWGGDGWDYGGEVIEVSDGSYVFVGTRVQSQSNQSKDVWIVKLDTNGNTLLTRTLEGNSWDYGESVIETSDDNYLIVGYTESYGIGNYDIWLIKTDTNGDTLWTRTYGSEQTEVGRCVIETNDGSYVIAGLIQGYELGLIKTDIYGDTLWTRTYGDTTPEMGKSLIESNDGSFVIGGTLNQDVGLIKTDADGYAQWTRTYGSNNEEEGNSVIETDDGNYLIVGSTFIDHDWNVWLIKTDTNGDTLWTRTYGGEQYEEFGKDVIQIRDGSYILVGGTTSTVDGFLDVLIINTDSNGNILWTQNYGGQYEDSGYSVNETDDGSFIIAGYTQTNGQNHNILIVKTQPKGPEIVNIDIQDNEIGLSWMEEYFERDRYQIYRKTGASEFVIIDSLQFPLDTFFVDTDVQNGLSYTYKITSITNGIESAFSNEVSGTPNAAPSLTPIEDQTILEDSIMQLFIDSTDPDDNDLTFLVQSSIDEIQLYFVEDSLHVSLNEDWNGEADITIIVSDYSLSDTVIFQLVVIPVNDQPTAESNTVLASEIDRQEIILSGSSGPSNESSQQLAYILENLPDVGILAETEYGTPIQQQDLPLFIIDSSLFFWTNERFAETSFQFSVQDDGGTSNGGVDHSTPMEIIIELGITDRFSYLTSGPIEGGLAMLNNDAIYATSSNDGIYRFDNTGTLLYTLNVNGEIKSPSTITANHDLYIASTDNNLYSFNINGVSNSGWPLFLGSQATASAAIDAIGNIYIGTSNGIYQAVNPTGDVLWAYNVGGSVYASSAISPHGTLYVTNENGRLLAFDLNNIDPDNVQARVVHEIGESVVSSPALDLAGNLYITTMSGRVIKFIDNGSSFEETWVYETGASIESSPIISSANNVLFGCNDSTVYCLDDNGQMLWSFLTGGLIKSTAALAEYDMPEDRIYIGSSDGYLYVLSISNGSIVWKYNAHSPIECPILYNEAVVYFGTMDGDIIAIEDGDVVPLFAKRAEVNPVWQTFQGNNFRTGRIDNIVAVASNNIPNEYWLAQNYPNPFNPSTTLRYGLPEEASVSLIIYDIRGNTVMTFTSESKAAGWYELTWNGLDDSGQPVSTGLYLTRLQAGSYSKVIKMLYLK